MSMFTLSLSPFDDSNVQTPAPILVLARWLSSFSNALGNVLATVYTINIYGVSWRYDADHTGKRSRKVLLVPVGGPH
jgi:hypothetical protein